MIGQTRDEAVAALARADLEPKIVEVFSEKEPGTVTGQSPEAGEKVKVGTRVQINVSRGVKPLTIPSVSGQPYESAASALQGAGFKVAPPQRRLRPSPRTPSSPSTRPPEARHPQGRPSRSASRRARSTSPVPDVTNQAEEDAVTTLEASGFNVDVQREATDDPALDGFVLSQDPAGGAQAQQGSTVTIVVGQFTP